MTQRTLREIPVGHCGLSRRHFGHRFWDPGTRDVYACDGWGRLPVGFGGVRRDLADTPQARHGVEAPLT